MDANAEALIRGDIALTLPIFREIARRLSDVLGQTPDPIDGVGHAVFDEPEQLAAYILSHTSPA